MRPAPSTGIPSKPAHWPAGLSSASALTVSALMTASQRRHLDRPVAPPWPSKRPRHSGSEAHDGRRYKVVGHGPGRPAERQGGTPIPLETARPQRRAISAGISLSLPAWGVNQEYHLTDGGLANRPTISNIPGVKARVRVSGPETSEAAKPRPTVPAHASKCRRCRLGTASVLPWARDTSAAISVSVYESSRVSSLLPKGQNFIRSVLKGLSTFGVGPALLAFAASLQPC